MVTRKQIRQIADAHISSKMSGYYDNPAVSSKDELIAQMLDGKTFSEVVGQIESRFISITSLLIASQFDHITEVYKKQIYKGIKTLLCA
tara:strand:- start:668 stop:934 length:267 start_codon:yes stop_codon:yes gene_type:complete